MKVRVFDGPDLAAAVGAVRRSLGDDALIVETRHVERGVEILAAIGPTLDDVTPLEIPVIADDYLDERRRNLLWHGLSEDLVARLTEQDLAQALARRVRFGSLDLSNDSAPLFFAGEPGAGKSLSLVKLAARLVMAGSKPLIISTDGQKAGATEQLAALTRILGLTLLVADQPQTLRRAMSMRRDHGPVLIDGQGLAADSGGEIAALRDLVAAAEAQIIVVAPAGLDAAETADIASCYAAIGATRMLATRLDVARRIGGIVEAAWRSRLMLTEAGVGPGIVDGLQTMTTGMIAERLERTGRRLSDSDDTGTRDVGDRYARR